MRACILAVAFATNRNHRGSLIVSTYDPAVTHEVAVMYKDARECLERAAECARLAEHEEHPELKRYLTKLAVAWTQAASETVTAQSQDA
jgi:hypothetical protein